MNQDVNGNRKLFRKVVSKPNGGKEENSNRIKDGNGMLALEETEVHRIWKGYCEYLYNIDTQEQVAVHLCAFDGVWRGNYFRGKLIRRTEVDLRLGKLKNEKAADTDDIIGDLDLEVV